MRLSQQAMAAAQVGSSPDSSGYDWSLIFAIADPDLAYRGFRSAPHPTTLPPGIAYQGRNIRSGPNEPGRKRNGVSTAVAAATGLAAGTYKGASDYYDDGTYVHQLIAWKHTSTSKIHIYHRKQTKSSGAWGNWAEITASSGKFGDTRMAAEPTNGRVQFFWCDVPGDDQTLTGDYHTFKDAAVCVVSDGTNVRIVDIDVLLNGPEVGDTDSGLAHAKAIPPPKGNIGVEVGAYDWLDLRDAAATADGAATADWLSITVAAAPRTWTFVTAATIAGGDAANVIFDTEEITFATYTSDTDYVLPRQVWLIAHSDKASFWKNTTVSFRWKISGGAYAWKAFDTPPLVLPTGTANYEFIVLELPDLLPENAADLLMNGLQFTSTALTPASCTITIYGFGVGGVVPGGTQYAIARRCRTSHVMSPGVVCGYTGYGLTKSEGRTSNSGIVNLTSETDFGGVMDSTVYSHATLPQGLIIPLDSRVGYTYSVSFSNPHTGELSDNAADYVVFYRKEPRDRDFYRVDRYLAATYATAGGWSYVSGTASSTLTYVDTTAAEYREFNDVLPDESNAPPPAWKAGGHFGARAFYLQDFIGGCKVLISEHGQPLRTTTGLAQSSDQRAAFNMKIPREKGRMVAQSVSETRVADVYVFTDESAWRVARSQDGVVMFDLARVSALGCSSGHSVAQLDGTLCWLDKNRDARVLGSPEGFVRFKVSEFDSVPDAYLDIVDFAYLKGRLFCTLTAAAGTEQTQVAVFNFAQGEWESLDTFSSTVEPEQWFNFRAGGANLLYYIGADGAIYEYEKSAQYSDAGQAIAFSVESAEYVNAESPNWLPIEVRHMGIVCTDLSSGTVTTTRTVTSPADSKTGTINIDVSTAYAWKWDDKSSRTAQESPGAQGNGIRLKWAVSSTAAFEFYALVAETKNLQVGGHG